MRTLQRIFATFSILLAIVAAANGQSSATTSASATIVSPLELSISRSADTAFSHLAVNAATTVDVQLTTGKKVLKQRIETPRISVADFTVSSGEPYAYAITLPSTVTLTHSSGSEKLQAATLLSTKQKRTLTTGRQSFKLFADVSLAGVQVAGLYTSEVFPVTVNHN